MEDVESDRFETQLNQIIRAFIDVAKTCIKVFPQDEDILPEISNRVSIKWKDIVKESSNMSIQYSGADNLSKDPSTKLQQLQQLSMAGVIPAARIPQLMQIPDLEMGYSLSNNAIDAVMAVIKSCIEDDVFDVPEFIPFELLKEEIINTQLSLTSAGYDRNKKDILKLEKLYEKVEDQAEQWVASADQENPEAAAPQGDQALPYNQNVLEQEANMVKTDMAPVEQKAAPDNAAWVDSNDLDRV